MPRRLSWIISIFSVVVAALAGSLSPIEPPRPRANEVTEIELANARSPDIQYPILHASNKQDELTIKQLMRWLLQANLIVVDKNNSHAQVPTGVQIQIIIGNIHSGKYIWLSPMRNNEIYYITTLNNGIPYVLYSQQLYDWFTHGYKSSLNQNTG